MHYSIDDMIHSQLKIIKFKKKPYTHEITRQTTQITLFSTRNSQKHHKGLEDTDANYGNCRIWHINHSKIAYLGG